MEDQDLAQQSVDHVQTIEEKSHIPEVGVHENLGLCQGIDMEIALMAAPKTGGIMKMVNISRNVPIYVRYIYIFEATFCI